MIPISRSPASLKLKRTIKKIVDEEGLLQKEVAKGFGIEPSYISAFMNGRYAISLENAEKILDHIGYEFVIVKKKGK